MNYELAKQLKDAGFEPRMTTGTRRGYYIGSESDQLYVPTLEELIEACGYGFDFLKQYSIPDNISWGAGYMYEGKGIRASGATPTEAVAHLWLALNAQKT